MKTPKIAPKRYSSDRSWAFLCDNANEQEKGGFGNAQNAEISQDGMGILSG